MLQPSLRSNLGVCTAGIGQRRRSGRKRRVIERSQCWFIGRSLAASLLNSRFGRSDEFCICTCAPGRVDVIGGRTDHNGGWVLPFAIEQSVHVALRPRSSSRVRICSDLMEDDEEFALPLHGLEPRGDWTDHIAEILSAFARSFRFQNGFELAVSSNLPM